MKKKNILIEIALLALLISPLHEARGDMYFLKQISTGKLYGPFSGKTNESFPHVLGAEFSVTLSGPSKIKIEYKYPGGSINLIGPHRLEEGMQCYAGSVTFVITTNLPPGGMEVITSQSNREKEALEELRLARMKKEQELQEQKANRPEAHGVSNDQGIASTRSPPITRPRQNIPKSQPLYVQDAFYRVNTMIQGRTLESADYVRTYIENVAPQSEPTGGYPDHVYVLTPGQGMARATSQNMPSVDKKAYVVFNFTYYSVGGIHNRRQGWLVYTRDSRSGRWSYSDWLSQIDHMPKNSRW